MPDYAAIHLGNERHREECHGEALSRRAIISPQVGIHGTSLMWAPDIHREPAGSTPR